MRPEVYLQNLIKNYPKYELTVEDKKRIQFEGVEEYIVGKLSSTRFRTSKIPEDLKTRVDQSVNNTVQKGERLRITVPFGGYKKWQLPSFPGAGWAEVFNACWLRDYVLPIVSAYEPGVTIEYFSDEIFVSRMNNYAQSDLDTYTKEFRAILGFISQFLPVNLEIKLSCIRDQISQEEMMRRFDKALPGIRRDFDKLPKAEQMYRLAKAKRNYKIDADFQSLSDNKQNEIIKESTLIHDVFIFGDWEDGVPWAFGEDMIPVGFRYTKSWGIPLRSAAASAVQFWVGEGILKRTHEAYTPTILTYEQYLQIERKLGHTPVSLFPSTIQNLQKAAIF